MEVTGEFLTRMDLSRGLMTRVDEERQRELVTALVGEAEPHKHTCGGPACNTVVAARHFGGNGYYACKAVSYTHP